MIRKKHEPNRGKMKNTINRRIEQEIKGWELVKSEKLPVCSI